MPGKKRREGPGGFSGTKVIISENPDGNPKEYNANVSLYDLGDLRFETDTNFSLKDEYVTFILSPLNSDDYPHTETLHMLVDEISNNAQQLMGITEWITEWVFQLGDDNYSYNFDLRNDQLEIMVSIKALITDSIESTPLNQWPIVGLPFDLYITKIMASYMSDDQWGPIEREVILGVYQRAMYDEDHWDVIDLQGLYEAIVRADEGNTVANGILDALVCNPTVHNLSTEHLKKSEIAPEDVVKILVETIQAFGEYQLVFYQGEYHAIDVG